VAELPTAETMLADARAETGFADWGGADLHEEEFLALFAAMRDSIGEDAQLTSRGLEGAELRLREMARERLALVAQRRAHPAIADERIEAPLIVLGLPRAGSSFLHNLLSHDPASRAPLAWELAFPAPFPGAETPAQRIARASAMFDAIQLFSPELAEFHTGGPEYPEECSLAMELTTQGGNLPGLWKLTSYNRLVTTLDPRIPYEMHRCVLQSLQYGLPPRRWVLKYPGHLFSLDALLAVYPDARMIVTHRDPAKVIPSVAATVSQMRRGNSETSLNEQSVARGNLAAYSQALGELGRRRAASPAENALYCDNHFRAMIADPLGAVRKVYDHFGMSLTSGAEEAMQCWLDGDEDHVAKRKFRLVDFGLDEAAIEDAFCAYLDHYGIERERPA
jgi:hypothetical protein